MIISEINPTILPKSVEKRIPTNIMNTIPTIVARHVTTFLKIE
jgi:hypothetical protein